jgi:hypothetical protein
MKYGRPHPLNGNREGQFAIDLAGAVRLVFEALDPIPKTSDDAKFLYSFIVFITKCRNFFSFKRYFHKKI